jgi:hypothetical protein
LLNKLILSKQEFHRLKKTNIITALRLIFYQITIILFLLLAVSGFLPVIILGGHLTGVPLIIHVTIAPFFCIFLALSVLFWVHFQRFFLEDLNYLKTLKRGKTKLLPDRTGISFWQKINFWMFAVFSLPAILSIILSMYPLFGTAGQDVLIQVHQYSTLLLFIVAVFHLYLLYVGLTKSEQKGKIV